MNEVFIFNSNYVIPDNYKYLRRSIFKKEKIKFFNFNVPILKHWGYNINKLVGYKYFLKLTKSKRFIEVKPEWERIKILAARKYPILLREEDEGEIKPIRINCEKSEYSKDINDTDLVRDFIMNIRNIRDFTISKWGQIGKVVIIALLVLFGLAALIVMFVLIGKFAGEHPAAGATVANVASNGFDFVNASSGMLG